MSPLHRHRDTPPSLLILTTLLLVGVFVGLPLALAYGRAGDHFSVLEGFAIVWGRWRAFTSSPAASLLSTQDGTSAAAWIVELGLSDGIG